MKAFADRLLADGGLRFMPLVGLAIMVGLFFVFSHWLGVRPVPDGMVWQARTGWIHPTPDLYFPFAMSSLVLLTLMGLMIGVSMVIAFQSMGWRELSLLVWLLGAAGGLLVRLGSESTAFGTFPRIESEINGLLTASNAILLLMLLALAFALSMLPQRGLADDARELRRRVRMFKVLIYLAALLLGVGLLEIFLLYDWRFGKAAAQIVALGNGILYSGLMIVLLLPTAWLLHESALQLVEGKPPELRSRASVRRFCRGVFQPRHATASATGHAGKKAEIEFSQLSPIAGIGHYVAAFLPAILGLLPSILEQFR
ncbi:MAG: hypothetical protein D6794_03565 [Deltaproteobacteria bacterium]|nr:MAG: hypothetical protein D6794_03565 [Deltaproteobacteria bacterium]